MTWHRPLAAVALLVGLTACGGSDDKPKTDGPLETYPDKAVVCLQQPADGLLTLGVEVTKNTSDRKLTITSIRLTDTKGMKLLGTKVMLIPDSSDQTLVGARNGWPPKLDAAEADVQSAFDKAPKGNDATVPGGHTRTVSFIAGVKTKAGATAGPLRVRYTDDDGHRYVWQGTTSYRTSAKPCDG
ncbi:hypothetical protein [Aeromicrobium sp. 9AM]|uniref:hypothetical protein n=1 Tax=Aeromicrobium sp. 9AM TaxID=2653126 RepID=UPI0013571145|nr:hypothetical protein [Aeromicrobium sp. 9AM]